MARNNKLRMMLIMAAACLLIFNVACSSKKDQPKASESAQESQKPTQSASAEPSQSAQPSIEPVELTFAFIGEGPTYDLFKKMFREYEGQHPNITINSQVIAKDFDSAILTRIAGGNPPDIFWTNNERMIPFADRDALLDLTPYDGKYFNKGDFMASAIDPFTYNGKVYSLPSDTVPDVLYYNKDLFDKAQVEYPKPDMTWDQMLDKAKKLTVKQGKKVVQYGYSMDNDWFYWAPFLWQAGGDILDETGTKSIVNSPENKEAFEFIRNMMFKDKVAPSVTDQKTTPSYQIFANGRAGMYLGGAWTMSTVFRENKFKWDIVRLPSYKHSASTVGLGGFVGAKTTKHPDEVAQFLGWFCGEPGQKYKFENGFAGMPTVNSLLETDLATKGFANPNDSSLHLQEIVEAAKVGKVAPKSVHWMEVMSELNKQLDLYWINKQDIDTTLKNADEKIQAVLTQ